jgi:UDP-N-acetylmuramate dehydrogenase
MQGQIFNDLKSKIKFNEPLEEHTTFRIGGQVKFFIQPEDTLDLKLLLKLARRHKMPVRILGAGSNVLAGDQMMRAVVLNLVSPNFKEIILKGNSLEAGSGLSLARLLQFALAHGLAGGEFLAGIPGTVGGALAMNAGCWGRAIADLVEEVEFLDYNGKIKSLQKRDIKFSYRQSSLAKYIILKARLKFTKGNKDRARQLVRRYLARRAHAQDSSFPNAGCIFKNPPHESAAKLIDLCGLKGKRIGGAAVSLKHANFILNRSHAKAGDVLKLMSLIQKKVKNRFAVTLEPEIKIWQ